LSASGRRASDITTDICTAQREFEDSGLRLSSEVRESSYRLPPPEEIHSTADEGEEEVSTTKRQTLQMLLMRSRGNQKRLFEELENNNAPAPFLQQVSWTDGRVSP